MPIDSRDLMSVATKLWSLNCEASKRSAVSRAYYAAFHEAKKWHSQLPEPGSCGDSRPGTHEFLINQLANPIGKTKKDKALAAKSKELSSELERLRALRNFADYDINENFDMSDHFALMVEVKDLLRSLGVSFAPPASPSLAPTTPAPSRIL